MTVQHRSLMTFSDEEVNHFHEISLDLTEPCRECDSNGKIADFDTDTISECKYCKGRGVKLGWQGQELLRFIREWEGDPAIDVGIE